VKMRNPLQFPRTIIAVFITLLAFLGWHIQYFSIDASADTLLVKNDQNYLISQVAGQRYRPEEFILVAFKPASADIFSEQTFKILGELTSEIEQLDRVKSVRSLINVPLFVGVREMSSDIDPDKLTWETQRYSSAEMKKILTSHPLYEGLLVNEEQTAIALQVVFEAQPKMVQLQKDIVAIESQLLTRELTPEEVDKLERLENTQDNLNNQLDDQRYQEIEHLREITDQREQAGTFYLGGGNLLAHQLIEIVRYDLVIFGVVIVLIFATILLWLFRQWRWVILPLFGCTLSVVLTLGLLGLLDLKVTVISANIVALQIIFTLAVIIHLIIEYQELAATGDYPDQAALVRETIRRKIKPCLYSVLTNSVGFGSLIFSGVQPVISFGWMMVLALVVTLLVSLLLFPALLIAFLPITREVKKRSGVGGVMRHSTDWVMGHTGIIAGSCGLILVLGIIGTLRLTAENSFLNYFRESTDVHRELTFIDKEFGGSTPLDILYRIPKKQQDPELIITAEAVQSVQSIQNKLEDKPAVGNITSIVDFTRIARVVTGKPTTEYELTALYRSLDKKLQQDLFVNYFAVEEQEVRISTRIQDSTPGLNRAELMRSIHQDMADLGIAPENYQLTNLFVLYQDVLAKLVESEYSTLAIVYAAMAVILLLIFRSLRIAIICLIPNIITSLAIMGGMGLLKIPLDLMTITIAGVAMGISVDDTIHYVHRFLEENKGDGSEAVYRTLESVGYAMVYTAALIIIGFSALAFSDFIPSVMFGLLTSIAMAIAVLTNLTILPILLRKFAVPGSKTVPNAEPHHG
jgi:predicted RND superfamily exporter protein